MPIPKKMKPMFSKRNIEDKAGKVEKDKESLKPN
jgi:hypothetical protein